MPHAHCPRCLHRVTLVATYWKHGAEMATQHVVCPSCGTRLVRQAHAASASEPWAEERVPD